MPSSAFWAYGSILQQGDGATPEAYSNVAEIIELTPPNMSRDEIDVTSHSSSDGYREFIGGLRDGGEVPFKANWLPSNATHDGNTGVLAQFNSDTNANWKIVLPNDTGIEIRFRGFVKEHNPDTPLEEQAQLEGSIKVSGKPTLWLNGVQIG